MDSLAGFISAIQGQYNKVKDESEARKKNTPYNWSKEEPSTLSTRIQARQAKEKTLPEHSSVFNIVAPAAIHPEAPPENVWTVDVRTFDTMQDILDGSRSQGRGNVTWNDFVTALAALGLHENRDKVTGGSKRAFFPVPSTQGPAQRPFHIHRPHGPKFEGHYLLYCRRRLKTVLGWTKESFKVA